MSRKTEFWKSTTPDKMGPGYYSSEPEKIKQNKAGFLIKAKRPMSVPMHSVRYTPGPGQYTPTSIWGNRAPQESSTFASKTKRNIFQEEKKAITPGPGHYEAYSVSASSSNKRPKYSALYLDPSPISIPSGDPPLLVNDSEETLIEPSKGTSFSKYRAKREVFKAKSSTPGPGTYNFITDKKGIQQQEWMFNSKSNRPSTGNKLLPGPGSYDYQTISNSKAAVFGIAEKNIPLSNDPYRPILVGQYEVPPVGTYRIAEDVQKSAKLKAKFITGENSGNSAPFNVKEKRDFCISGKDELPGPGEYETSRKLIYKESTPFGSALERFYPDKNQDYPGPGTYDAQVNNIERASPMFSSRTPRFINPRDKSPEPYLAHKSWRKKETRAVDVTLINNKICFDSSEPRFRSGSIKESREKVGPGSYNGTRPNTVASVALSKTDRFKGFGTYRPPTGSDQLGPGYYNPPLTAKRSFNMAKELNHDRTWM